MVKALSFKGDKKPSKKRKHTHESSTTTTTDIPSSTDLTTTTQGTTTAEPDEDDAWVTADSLTDISGPIILLLPKTTSPTTLTKPSATPKAPTIPSLSTDALGTIFPLTVQNLVQDQEYQTAEPHDVRQVWIATKVVGTERDFTFKGFHGKYLGCDEFGILSAKREAVSPEETFRFYDKEGEAGWFDVRGVLRSGFLGVQEKKGGGGDGAVEVRGDVEESGEGTGVRVRMQARFKPKHKTEKAEKVRAKISRRELEEEVGRRLEDDEVKRLKRARREGDYHEVMLDVKVKGKHDKYA